MKNIKNMAVARLMREYQEFMEDATVQNLRASPASEDNLFLWDAYLIGPKDSKYDGQEFHVQLKFSDDYPFVPPKVSFLTPIKHPHIYKDGHVCLDTIGTNGSAWSPAHTVISLLNTLLALLDTLHG